MANPGVGTKFVSVNLNKSYGQQHGQGHQHHHHKGGSSFNGIISGSRAWSGVGSRGGGGMVVLSRPRSSQKAGPKLSVPPPLNLPSLTKEHEKFDVLGSVGGLGASGISGSGMRSGSVGMGWTKPVSGSGPQDKDKEVPGFGDKGIIDGDLMHVGVRGMDFGVRSGSAYRPPSARSSGGLAFQGYSPVVEKAMVLRGEDFPSLRAAIPIATITPQKQKDSLSRKQEQAMGEEIGNNEGEMSIPSSALVDMHPQVQLSRNVFANSDDLRVSDQNKKRDEYFSVPLPIVRLNPRSDWADDERDTGHGLMDRGRGHGYSKNDAYWDGDFFMPRASYLPHKPASNSLDRWGSRDDDTEKLSTGEVHKSDGYHHNERNGRGASKEGREGNSWRSSALFPKVTVDSQELRGDRNSLVGRSSLSGTEVKRDNKYAPSAFQNGAVDDIWRKEFANGQGQQRNHNSDSLGGRAVERSYRNLNVGNSSRHNGNFLKNNSARISSFGSRGPPSNYPALNSTWNTDKPNLIKSDKSYMDDSFLNDFDHGTELLTGSLVGVVKRKKEVVKSVEFYDPVRESFEAELERVQKMQEQERQRVIEEQERALELYCREEAERARRARELEEQQRRKENEAREAALRAEQERLEVLRRAEEQRIAREEEKQRILMEEERRKLAAKQKLLELEEKIARRQAGAGVDSNTPPDAADGRVAGLLNEKCNMEVTEVDDWEDSEKTIERITTSASSDSSNHNRPFDIGSRPNFGEIKRKSGKLSDTWRRDPFSAVNSSNFCQSEQESGYYGTTRRDPSIGDSALARKDFYSASGYSSSRNYAKGVLPEYHMEQPKAPRWNLSDGDHLNQNADVDSECHENIVERHGGDIEWGQGRSGSSLYSPYPEQISHISEPDVSYSFGRSRYSLRQPRVLPPPTLASMHKNSYRGEIECPRPSTLLGNDMLYATSSRLESTVSKGYDNSHQEYAEQDCIEIRPKNVVEPNLNQKVAPLYDSLSSLSVSSLPDSPVHLSHDDQDESGDYPGKSSVGDRGLLVSGNGMVLMPISAAQENLDVSGSDYSGEEGEWSMENDELLQEQEEYDEDEECYQEEEEPQDVDENNINPSREFDDICMENGSSPDNLVLGFDEGIEVPIPNEELERSLGTELVDYAVPLSTMANVEVRHASGGVGSHVRTEQQIDDSNKPGVVVSPRMLLETEKAMEHLAIDVDSRAVKSTVSETLGNSDASGGSIPLGPHSSGNTVLPSEPSSAQAKIPVKLQFGAFSGPSLIPSPVPAIQIGSIKMPLHLHPHVVPSPSTAQQLQSPIFQFGQLKYSSAISPGIIPLTCHSLSSLHSNGTVKFSYNQNQDGLSVFQAGPESAQKPVRKNVGSHNVESQSGHVPRYLIMHEDNDVKKSSAVPAREKSEDILKVQESGVDHSQAIGNNTLPSHPVLELGRQTEASRRDRLPSTSRKQEQHAFLGSTSTNMIRKENATYSSRVNGSISGAGVRHYAFKVKNASSRSFHPETDPSDLDSSGYQRRPRCSVKWTEFRVRENREKRRLGVLRSVAIIGPDDQPNMTSRSTSISSRSWSRKAVIPNKLSKEISEPNPMRSIDDLSLQSDFTGGNLMRSLKELPEKGQIPDQVHLLEQQSRSNAHEEDIDATLQSGVVRVFEQPGIEAPSDEDDFIEVRSKRQMLNDKREQREKEIKAKSRISKVPRRPRTLQNVGLSSGSKRNSSFRSRETLKSINSDGIAKDGRGLTSPEMPAVFSKPLGAQSLPPIGTSAVRNDAQADSSSQKIKTDSHPMVSKDIRSDFMFDCSNKAVNNFESLDSWRISGINQQVMQLTLSQLDEAMKPAEFDPLASVGDPNFVNEPSVPSSSVLPKDKSFSYAASPINSLLSGEKIQFGAVTSPTVLPSRRHSAPHGIGPPGPLSDVQMPQKLLVADDDCSIFFDKEKNSGDSCPQLKDCEAEAEAAASAVAVAAITSDEIVGNGLCAGTTAVSDTNTFRAAEISGILTGIAHDQRSAARLRAEEPLNVSLPADLSIDTPPISLWQPLAGQTTSSQMLSHIPGGPPSNYPFYKMNPILGSPIFAFGPNEDSGSSQPQNSSPSSGPRGRWQPALSGIDSFYGPPAGFTGPFISPGGIHQGPPHMVVYNHFTPGGQFGQVGLSFMGTTFIPSSQQPDWKHNPASSPMVVDGDMKNMNGVPAWRNTADMPPPAQPLSPGSPLMPTVPAAMFDVHPFQSSPEMSVRAQWPRIPPTQLHASSLGVPMPLHTGVPPQFNNGHSIDQSINGSRFIETRTSTPDTSHNFSSTVDTTTSRLPDDLALLEPSSPSLAVSIQNLAAQSSSYIGTSNAGNSDFQNNDNVSSSSTDATGFKIRPPQHNNGGFSQNNVSSLGYNNQRGGASQKGGEWTHRGGGFYGRNQSFGHERSFSSSKVKQIYVAKQTLITKSTAS